MRSSIVRAWGALFGGSTAAAAIGLAATALMARELPLQSVGIYVILQTYWRTVEGFVSFQSYQTVVKFAADATEASPTLGRMAIRRLLKVVFLTDLIAAIVAAVAGILLLKVFARFIELPAEYIDLAKFGGASLCTLLVGAASGYLRHLDRFIPIAGREVLVAVIRLIGTIYLIGRAASVEDFFLLWLMAELAGVIFLNCIAAKAWFEKHNEDAPNQSLQNRSQPIGEILRMLFGVNLATMIKILTEEGDSLLVSRLVSIEAAALYKMAKNFAGILYRVSGPAAQAFYPHLARASAMGNRADFIALVRRTHTLGFLICIVSVAIWVLFGERIITLAVGEKFAGAENDLRWLGAAYGVGFIGFGIIPSLTALGSIRGYILTAAISTSSFFGFSMIAFMLGLGSPVAVGMFASFLVALMFSLYVLRLAMQRKSWRE